jgi:hypothetical protein
VLTPTQAIQQLIALVNGMNLNHIVQNALDSHLNAALQFLTHSQSPKAGACVQLSEFVIQVQGAVRLNEFSQTQALQFIK